MQLNITQSTQTPTNTNMLYYQRRCKNTLQVKGELFQFGKKIV